MQLTEQHIRFKMTTIPETQLSAADNKRDKLDSKLNKLESAMKRDMGVNCRENLNEYLFNSTLHGLRYVGDRTITRVERL